MNFDGGDWVARRAKLYDVKAKPAKRRVRWGSLLLIALVLWLVWTFGQGFMQSYQLRQDLAEVESRIRAVEIRNENIRDELERLQSAEYVERVAREELGLVNPGEELYILSQPMPED